LQEGTDENKGIKKKKKKKILKERKREMREREEREGLLTPPLSSKERS
jgi:hypothetical protein